jgi:DnaJ domain
MANYFEVLGVSQSATDAEINDAYRALARQFHPDQHPEASSAERAAWSNAMASINEAWAALRNPDGRQAYRDSLYGPEATAEHVVESRPPHVGECDLCGSAPATTVLFRHQHAWIIRSTIYSTTLELCRSCGLALGRARQNRTLLAGWWGILSFFRNIGIVWTNSRALHRVASLSDPHRDRTVATPLTQPLPPGRSVFGRAGIWVSVGAATALAAIVVDVSSQPAEPAVTPWAVGTCVVGLSTLSPVDCDQPHTGRIVQFASSSELCPQTSEIYTEDAGGVWCIDRDR